jgi:hypothetical protein
MNEVRQLAFKTYIVDSLRFTKETFTGNKINSGIILLLGLCLGIIIAINPFLLKSSPNGVNWNLAYPWWEVIVFLILWILIDVILSGYCIRIFRGGTPPPSFTNGGTLAKEGFIVQISILVWVVPAFISACIIRVFHMPQFFWVLFILLIVPLFVGPVVYFLYAHTGNFFESIRFSKIQSSIRTFGWRIYLGAWGLGAISFLVLAIVYSILAVILSHILPDQIGSIGVSVIAGFAIVIFAVFISKFFTNVLMNSADMAPVDCEKTSREKNCDQP